MSVRLDELSALPTTLSTEQAAELLGISPWSLGDLHRREKAPVRPLRLGRKLRWPTAELLRVLGIDTIAEAERDSAPGYDPEALQIAVPNVTPIR